MDSNEKWPSGGSIKPKNMHSTKNKCQFCAALFIDEASCTVHSENCVARLSAFLASDGRIKFACMVCRDVFDATTELGEHEQLHKFPGGFGCTICNETFRTETERVRHTEDVHKAFQCLRCENGKLVSTVESYIGHCEREHNGESGYAVCLECGAGFEEKSHLRFHRETECGQFRGWPCFQCAPNFQTENALNEHVESHLQNGIKCELEFENVHAMEFASTERAADLPALKVNDNFYDPMEIDPSQYLDEVQLPEETLDAVKIEALDPNDRFKETSEEQQDEVAGSSESEYRSEVGEDTRERQKGRKLAKRFPCKFCSSSFPCERYVNHHLRMQHRHEVDRNEKSQFDSECQHCGRCFSAPQHLEQHVRDTHAKFECDKCGLAIMKKMELRQHFASDCGRKPVNVCIVCEKSFDTANELKAHKATHTRNQLVCSKCSKIFDTYERLRAHFVGHKTKSDWFECVYCEKKFRHENSMRSHMVKHTGVKPNQCQACGERFVTVAKLLAHRKSHPKTCKLVPYIDASIRMPDDIGSGGDGSKPAKIIFKTTHKDRMNDLEFTCGICDQKYTYERHLDKHILVHGPDGKLVHKCAFCAKYFATIEEKDKHTNEIHTNEITCPHCKKVYPTRPALRLHIKYMHLKQRHGRRHTCIKCGLSYISKEFLENHEKSDCGRIPIFKCAECGKCLSNKYTYRAHLSLHRDDSETKTFICSYCGKAWRNKSQLQSHTRFHTNERPYKCDYCDKSFCDPTSRKTHESIHTGIKPYMCQCGDRFSCISNLQSHRRARKTTCGLLPLISKKFPQMIPENLDSAKK